MSNLGRAEIQYFERGQSLFVTFDNSRHPHLAVHRCEFEGGSFVTPSGAFHIFSGPSPRCEDLDLSPPANHENSSEVGDTLTTLIQSRGCRVRLHYSSFTAARSVAGTFLSRSYRTLSLWVLTGCIVTAHGRMVPIGWSGRDCGLTRLRDHEARELLARTIEAVDLAESMSTSTPQAVLAPSAAAVILHETVGHFAEAAIEEGVDLRHRIGCRIASEIFSLHDDPLAIDGQAHYVFDDDGVMCSGPNEIVREGILIAQLHSLTSAKATGVAPTANGRAATAWVIPIPRVSNLICAPGTTSEDQLVEDVGTGIYVHQLADGFSLGTNIEARIVLAEWIRRGRRTGHFLTGGQVKEHLGMLTRAVEIGNKSIFNANAMCGKAGQVLFDVGTCAPAIRFSTLRIVT